MSKTFVILNSGIARRCLIEVVSRYPRGFISYGSPSNLYAEIFKGHATTTQSGQSGYYLVSMNSKGIYISFSSAHMPQDIASEELSSRDLHKCIYGEYL
jgi:hypothetical protein